MKRLTAAFLCIVLRLQSTTGDVGKSDDKGHPEESGNLSNRGTTFDGSIITKVTDAFEDDNNTSLNPHVSKLASIPTMISTLNHKDAGLTEIQELSKILNFLTTILQNSVSDVDLPSSVKDVVKDLTIDIPRAYISIQKIEDILQQVEISSLVARKNESTKHAETSSDSFYDKSSVTRKTRNVETYTRDEQFDVNRRLTFETDVSANANAKSKNEYTNSDSYRSNSDWDEKNFFSSSFDFNTFSRRSNDKIFNTNRKHSAHFYKRSGGTNRRRLNDNEVCEEIPQDEYKYDQCKRLAKCANRYSIYDLYVYIYGDDVDFTNGGIRKEEKIEYLDDKLIRIKYKDIISKSAKLLTNLPVTEDESGECNDLLQEFHRFDETIAGINAAGLTFGKWQGGTVNSVCRESDTTKNLNLESILMITRNAKYGQFELPANQRKIFDYLNLFDNKRNFHDLLLRKQSPEWRTVEMFEDFVFSCAGKLGNSVGAHAGSIFKNDISKNPYIHNGQFSIPNPNPKLLDRDEYGQVSATVLDEFFTYIPIESVANDKFGDSLKLRLARTIASDKKSFNEFAQAYAEVYCSDKSHCIDQLKKLEKQGNDLEFFF